MLQQPGLYGCECQRQAAAGPWQHGDPQGPAQAACLACHPVRLAQLAPGQQQYRQPISGAEHTCTAAEGGGAAAAATAGMLHGSQHPPTCRISSLDCLASFLGPRPTSRAAPALEKVGGLAASLGTCASAKGGRQESTSGQQRWRRAGLCNAATGAAAAARCLMRGCAQPTARCPGPHPAADVLELDHDLLHSLELRYRRGAGSGGGGTAALHLHSHCHQAVSSAICGAIHFVGRPWPCKP